MKKPIPNDLSLQLQDGTTVKMLKRHLAGGRSLSPAQFRAMWNLPPDYPMVAPGRPGLPAAAGEPAGPEPEKASGEQRTPERG